MNEFEQNFNSFNFAGDLVVNDEDEKIDFKTLGIENSNENDKSEINDKVLIFMYFEFLIATNPVK